MKVIDYVILTSYDSDRLAERVKTKLAEGWELHGPAGSNIESSHQHQHQGVTKNEIKYYQPMILVEK